MRENLIQRRSILKQAAFGLTSLVAGDLAALPDFLSNPAESSTKPGKKGFVHRGYLGWITDLATQPDPKATWPSIRLDEQLLRDYDHTFGLMQKLGFNEISIWGLYVAYDWPLDIKSAVTPKRGAMVERLIDAAHKRGIRVYSGLGVYCCGFDEIIKANPRLSKGNQRVMCPSQSESWRWMEKVVDFVLERFLIDGVSMQSADQGRCTCDQCSVYSDAEYHALVNVRTSEYIRSRWPHKTIGVNSWGLRFEAPETLPSLLKISQKVDYLIDVHDSSRKQDRNYRKQVIEALACDFGTLGGPQVEPPQHWKRDRWFLPTLKRVGEHLKLLSEEGGRACEYFFHILANPGDEVSFWLAGKVLSDPQGSWTGHLQDCVEELYQVSKGSTRDALLHLFLEAEEAYFKHLPPGVCGTISMEPLVSDRPGPPIYLSKRLNAGQRASYAKDLEKIKRESGRLISEVARKDKMRKIAHCVENVLRDIAAVA